MYKIIVTSLVNLRIQDCTHLLAANNFIIIRTTESNEIIIILVGFHGSHLTALSASLSNNKLLL